MKIGWVIVTLGVFTLQGCGGSGSNENKTESWINQLTIVPYESACMYMFPINCQTGEFDEGAPGGSDNALTLNNDFRGVISGLEFKWGFVQTLSIETTYTPDPPQDGSSITYRLLSVISEQEDPAGTHYTIPGVLLHDDRLPIGYSEQEEQWFYFDKAFACSTGADCETLLDMNTSGASVELTFEYLGNEEIRLIGWN